MWLKAALACVACSVFLVPNDAHAQRDAYDRAETALLDDGDARAAIWYLTPQAENGDLKSQVLLGMIHERGSCAFRRDACSSASKTFLAPDFVQAVKWYRLAAAQGDDDSQFVLGSIYMTGRRGVPASYGEAAKWYRPVAEQGDVSAQLALGTIYLTGGDIPANHEESASWFRRAAEAGDPVAQQTLGFLYLTGQGVQRNVVYALMWYELLARPDFRSGEIRRNLTAALSEDQRARASALADECVRASYKSCALRSETELAAREPNAPEQVLYSVVTADDYPAISIRLQEQGTVGFKVRISRTGAIAACEVTASSGKPRLDEAACRTARKWLLLPAMRDGAPIEIDKTLNIVFQLQ